MITKMLTIEDLFEATQYVSMNVKEYRKRHILQMAKSKGFEVPEDATINESGNVEYFDGIDTLWEVDPVTGESRHCGIQPGCFWTEWE